MPYFHAVVWIDHQEAHVIHFNPGAAEALVIHSTLPNQHLHHKRGEIGAGRVGADAHYFKQVEAALVGTGEILITGPANAKDELVKHLRTHAKALADHVVAVETIDHPSDAQLLQMARKYFKAADRMQ